MADRQSYHAGGRGACGSLMFLDNNVFCSMLTHFLIEIILAIAVII